MWGGGGKNLMGSLGGVCPNFSMARWSFFCEWLYQLQMRKIPSVLSALAHMVPKHLNPLHLGSTEGWRLLCSLLVTLGMASSGCICLMWLW